MPASHRLPNRFRTLPAFAVTISPVLRVAAYRGTMEERRATPRQRVFKAGSIEFDGSDIGCTIRNISVAGAALDVASPVGIPHEVTLNVLTGNLRQHCFIIWRKERRIGVAFD
jgi:PilZ domain